MKWEEFEKGNFRALLLSYLPLTCQGWICTSDHVIHIEVTLIYAAFHYFKLFNFQRILWGS